MNVPETVLRVGISGCGMTGVIPQGARRHRNIENLARVIYTEAQGNGRDAMTAVSHTIRNRMTRNAEGEVDKVWGGYSHGARPSQSYPVALAAYEQARQIAAVIIDGTIPDPKNGATHYYSPQARNTVPVPAPERPNEDGFETVPGVVDRFTKQPSQNTYPDWSRSPDFEPRPMPIIPQWAFKFHRQKKEGRVR